jgi:hypothetical protein
MPSRSLDGLRFRSLADVEGGDVGTETIFHYAEDDGVVHARYEGGAVVLGFLVGRRDGDRLEFRYAQLRADGTTATGHCVSQIETLADGRLRMNETWHWDSADGSGTSTVEEIASA